MPVPSDQVSPCVCVCVCVCVQIRCHQYWPEDNKPVTVFGDIIITKLTEDVYPDWTVRALKVERVTLSHTHTHTHSCNCTHSHKLEIYLTTP